MKDPEDEAFDDLAKRQGCWNMQGSRKHQIMQHIENKELNAESEARMTQDEIIEMAREALKQEPREDWNSTAWVFADETLQAFAKLVAEKEREACAKVVDALEADCINRDVDDTPLKKIALAIRAKGQA